MCPFRGAPEPWKEYCEVSATIGENLRVDTVKGRVDPFLYRTILINVLTELHLDVGEWNRGLASLVVFGDFTGAHLCLPNLGYKLEMGPESQLLLQDRELEHYTTMRGGSCRYCVVHTTHEDVRAIALNNIKAAKDQIGGTSGGH